MSKSICWCENCRLSKLNLTKEDFANWLEDVAKDEFEDNINISHLEDGLKIEFINGKEFGAAVFTIKIELEI